MKAFVALIVAIISTDTAATTFPKDSGAIEHVLSRTGFGSRPSDVTRVSRLGIEQFIDQQLHPDRVDDAAMTARLAGLTTVGLSSQQIAEQYAIPQLEARRERKQQAQNADPNSDGKQAPDPIQQRANSVMVELSEQKLLRAVYSERQLEEVLTDFWFNHFNVDARKGVDRFMLTEYERDAIRPHVLGKFRDLLGATAKSPAMLFYLDNWVSAAPNGPGKSPRGLNENYGRELMELHTLGVDGGYTQKDVTEVARALTGWTIDRPRQGGGFVFNPRIHDAGQKIVLGHVIEAGGGQDDGERVLDMLASHPSTATFIATKLARRFVSDTPSPALIARVTARFRDSGGDLREVTRAILTSPEFLSPSTYHSKVKTPFEFVVSALRATGADVQDARPLVREVQQLGMPLYMCQPPTGYKDTAEAWVNTGALVGRLNLALRLASGQVKGTSVDRSIELRLTTPVSDTTVATIAAAGDQAKVLALTLGSPEFQRR
jgi:uncharacterized protein (DUF1800 family)